MTPGSASEEHRIGGSRVERSKTSQFSQPLWDFTTQPYLLHTFASSITNSVKHCNISTSLIRSSTALITDYIIRYFCLLRPSSHWTGSSTRAGASAGRWNPNPYNSARPAQVHSAHLLSGEPRLTPSYSIPNNPGPRGTGHPKTEVMAVLAVRLCSQDMNAILEPVRLYWRFLVWLTDSVLRLLNQRKRDFYFT